MNAQRLTAQLTTQRFGRWVDTVDRVGSTNARAAAWLAREPLPEGALFLADRQSGGRGTGGRPWLSDDPDGLWLSLVLQEPIGAMPLPFLTGIALVDVLREQCGIDAHLKWPNDEWVDEAKLSGALIESQRQPDGRTAWIVGIGVNVNQERLPDAIRDLAVSMRMVTGASYEREWLCAALLAALERHYDAGGSLLDAWRARSRMLGRPAELRRGDQGSSGRVTVLDLTPEGFLQVVHEDGRREDLVASTALSLRPCWD